VSPPSSSDQRGAIREFGTRGTIEVMRWILRLVANAVALAIATWILSGISLTGSSTTNKIITLLIVALIFGILNAIIKPLFALFTAPLILLTLGLFLIVINACMLLLTSWLAGLFDLGWKVDGFWTAVLGAIIISIVSFVLNVFLPDPDDRRRD
jgi:putative membrane protein